MNIKKYAFLVKDSENHYEVFDLMMLPFNDDEFFHRWNTGMSSDSVVMIRVSGVEDLYIYDAYDGHTFYRSDRSGKHVHLTEGRDTYALVSEGHVFGTLSFESNSFTAKKYEAATSQEVTVLDVTETPGVNLGYVWDGANFIAPDV